MHQRFLAPARWIFGALVLMNLTSCGILPRPTAAATRNRAFVTYWPPDESNPRLRLAVKDLIDMEGVVTTAGSEYIAKNRPPAARDARCLQIARERNVQIVGKTNLTEFALGTSGLNKYFGTPRNPLVESLNLIPGGSSSGSAVAVASGMADLAFGTDTAGSIRTPAACCGIMGLKTTFGLVPLDGVFPLAPYHLDTVGPMARDIPGLVEGMDLLQRGFTGRYRAAVSARPKPGNITVGRLYIDGTDPKIDRAIDRALAESGFRVVPLGDRFKQQWNEAHRNGNVVALADSWLMDRQYLSKPGVSTGTKAAILLGELEYKRNYGKAMASREGWRQTLASTFRTVDFIALPTLKEMPPRFRFLGRRAPLDARMLSMQNTVAVSFAGNPALAMPISLEAEKVPVTSLQLVGPRLSEAGLLNAGRLVAARQPAGSVSPE